MRATLLIVVILFIVILAHGLGAFGQAIESYTCSNGTLSESDYQVKFLANNFSTPATANVRLFQVQSGQMQAVDKVPCVYTPGSPHQLERDLKGNYIVTTRIWDCNNGQNQGSTYYTHVVIKKTTKGEVVADVFRQLSPEQFIPCQ